MYVPPYSVVRPTREVGPIGPRKATGMAQITQFQGAEADWPANAFHIGATAAGCCPPLAGQENLLISTRRKRARMTDAEAADKEIPRLAAPNTMNWPATS
jgi:hypothetical protein